MVDRKTVKAAEREMRRKAPDTCRETEEPPKKRRKQGESFPRYAYSALDSNLRDTRGFIITCRFNREKSAMHEFCTLANKLLDLKAQEGNPAKEEAARKLPSNANDDAVGTEAGRKLPEDKEEGSGREAAGKLSGDLNDVVGTEAGEKLPEDQEDGNGGEAGRKLPESAEVDVETGPDEDNNAAKGVTLVPVKLRCSGIVLMVLNGWEKLSVRQQPTQIVKQIIQQAESQPLRHCSRIIPVEGMCEIDNKDDVKSAVGHIVEEFGKKLEGSCLADYNTFAVGLKVRGNKAAVNRASTISMLADGMVDAFSQQKIKVDLKDPKVALLCDVLPTSNKTVGALCLIERGLISSVVNLSIKSVGR